MKKSASVKCHLINGESSMQQATPTITLRVYLSFPLPLP